MLPTVRKIRKIMIKKTIVIDVKEICQTFQQRWKKKETQIHKIIKIILTYNSLKQILNVKFQTNEKKFTLTF